MLELSIWDIAWVVVVASQATLTAYVTHPQGKALLITIPLPFSVAFLALGKPIESSHILGAAMLLPFMLLVRFVHVNLKQHIVTGMVAGVIFFSVSGTVAVRLLPRSEAVFFTILAAVLIVGCALVWLLPYRVEPGHRSTMPVWLKLLLIVGGILLLIQAKQAMRGFVTLFPLVSTVAAYEARRSLWTMVRQVPVKMVATTLMMLGMYLVQPRLGAIGALAVGWCIFGIVLPIVSRLKDARHGTCIPDLVDGEPARLAD